MAFLSNVPGHCPSVFLENVTEYGYASINRKMIGNILLVKCLLNPAEYLIFINPIHPHFFVTSHAKHPSMSVSLDLHGSFIVHTPEGGYINVNPELGPEHSGVSPTGRYHVFYAHPEHGSCTFVVEQDDNCAWFSDRKPPFVTDEFVGWLGERIESYSK